MAYFIDRRLNGKNKSAVNRQRFLRRYKSQIKQSIAGAINKRSVTDVENGESISISNSDISEPMFHQGRGGIRHRVHPGNDHFVQNDKIERPQGGGGGGSGQGDAGQDGEGQDEFVFQISKDEYLDLLFEDLALPNLKKTEHRQLNEYKTHRAGYTANGVPANISVVRSLQNSLARRMAMTAGKRRELHQREEDLALLENTEPVQLLEEERLRQEIAELRQRIASVPFIDTFDLRYKNYERRPEPSSQAVMFCLMDVSGSMDQATKDIAKRFYILLYLFLSRTYKNVEVVYIRHHTQAKEVDEQEFFYSQETGGTIVSSALKLMEDVVKERYNPAQWNIYAAQASDGDNWADDSPLCRELLATRLLPVVRYYSYIEITRRSHQTLWREYEMLQDSFDNFAMQHIRDQDDIYPVFREIFHKQTVNN
ncbi:YeaH/YhbH family protein [Dickeya dianthicola]|uniref:YeaH/YhbH family protein n=1 Tax=Dickeya dianthicola TaxID=204039 RepID=UPI0003A56FCF|nr:YeaH/YhbH family protein [Dickeya dianthicola]MCI4032702.1 YeaH/YhbH family protein [Dickeya dianthicola]MCI4172620.1 YeaH/YhbH family protein [Dickeya dianthicola]MCI4178054.1 YeaH/YhbH family protein [Dickeya dianthicola]MCI4183943.1 YeaH/YhbH family protein [Dickeya dianthicola]MCI4184373.1 YeaH/YhbH family protein [Dickeya dianthicola]